MEDIDQDVVLGKGKAVVKDMDIPAQLSNV